MGGAVFSLFGQVSISESTLSGNSAVGGPGGTPVAGPDGGTGDGLGGGIFNVDGSVAVSGSTIAANTASGGSPAGGGVYSLAFGNSITSGAPTSATVTFAGSILYGNLGGGLYLNGASAKDASTSNLVSPTIIGSTIPQGNATAFGSPITSDPALGPLQDNGGSLQTMMPSAGSPAFGAGTSCDATDELGRPRPRNGCDLGALELTPLAPAVSTSAATAISETGATLNGDVNPEGVAATYQFELSTSSTFATFRSLPSPSASVGPGTTLVAVSATATKLVPGTAYYYRLVATNRGGSRTSSVERFVTLGGSSQSIKIRLGDRKMTLTVPSLSACVASGSKLEVELTLRKLAKGPKTKLFSFSFFVGKGLKQIHHKWIHTKSGKRKRIKVVVYVPNAVAYELPASLALPLTDLKPGVHKLTLKTAYSQVRTKDGHKTTINDIWITPVQFTVC